MGALDMYSRSVAPTRRAIGALLLTAGGAVAQGVGAFPSRPVRILVGFAPGGATDAVARFLGERLAEVWGQPVIVENRAGANQFVAITALRASPPDGHTLLMGTSGALVVTPVARTDAVRDAVLDLTPIAPVVEFNDVIVARGDIPVRTLGEFLVWARAKPSEPTYGSPGVGSVTHIAGAAIADLSAIPMTHVAYRGDSAMMNDLVAGRLDFAVVTAHSAVPFIREGRLRGLAIARAQPPRPIEDMPAAASAGLPGFDLLVWAGLMGPPGLPPSTTLAINQAVSRVLAEPDVARAMERNFHFSVMAGGPDDFRRFLDDQRAHWRSVADRIGFRAGE